MPRARPVDDGPRFLATDLTRQILPGSCEYALHHLLDRAIELEGIRARIPQERRSWVAAARRALAPGHAER